MPKTRCRKLVNSAHTSQEQAYSRPNKVKRYTVSSYEVNVRKLLTSSVTTLSVPVVKVESGVKTEPLKPVKHISRNRQNLNNLCEMETRQTLEAQKRKALLDAFFDF